MMETWLTTELSRTITTYVCQAVLGVLLFIIFRYFNHIYRHNFLRTWAWSWLAFVVFMIATAIISVMNINQPQSVLRFSLTLLATFGSLLHALLVLAGTLELTNKWASTKKEFLILVLGILLVSLVMVSIYATGAEHREIRYIIRIGIKYLLTGSAFVMAGVLTFRNRLITKGIGQKVLATGFVLYGLINFYYVFVVFFNVFGHPTRFPIFFGLLELTMICIIGIGMVIWLLQDEREKLKKINQELDSFLYSTSHDLRAPIASILGLTNLARLEIPDKTSLDYISMIEDRVKKLDLVISDILHLSRTSKAEVKYEQIDFNALLADVISDVKFNEGAAKISLRYESSPTHIFSGDYAQMKIILGNLISNAVRYHRTQQPDPFIAVRFSRVPLGVSIEVEDNGEGIEEEHHEKIFEMFYRSSHKTEGTGLGLYIVKEALNKVNGSITVRSQIQVGSTFTINLPQN